MTDKIQKNFQLLITLTIVIAIGIITFMASVLLERIASLLAMIISGILVAYLIIPGVKLLQRKRVPKALSVLAVYLLGALIVGGAGIYAVPKIGTEAGDLARNAPAMAQAVQERLDNAANDPLLSKLPTNVRESIGSNIGSVEDVAGKTVGNLGLHALEGFKTGAEGLIRTLLVLLIAFFLITDAERIATTVLRIVSLKHRENVLGWIVEIDEVVGGFVRGQLLLAAVTGIAVILFLMILHIKYATILGILAGIACIIPFVGPIIGSIPIIIVAAATAGTNTTLILSFGLLVIFEVQGHILTPVIIGRAVKVTPMVVFLSILAGAEVYGLLGTLLAIPVAGILRVTIDRLYPSDKNLDTLVKEILIDKKIDKKENKEVVK